MTQGSAEAPADRGPSVSFALPEQAGFASGQTGYVVARKLRGEEEIARLVARTAGFLSRALRSEDLPTAGAHPSEQAEQTEGELMSGAHGRGSATAMAWKTLVVVI